MSVTLDAAGLADAASIDSDAATRLLPVVTARVERYASGAPDALHDEAAIRFAAYLAGATPNPNAAGNVGIGSLSITNTSHSHAAAFRLCGAAGLLSPWRVRRAGSVG